MTELTDLEIRSIILKIEGHTIEHIHGDAIYITDKNLSDITGDDEYINYNPLTDDALCFQLMVKYNVILISVNESYGTGPIIGYNAFYKQLTDKIYLNEVNPNKAILLAIIEAHKD